MTPGGGAGAPQPRVAPAAPQAPVVVAPQVPVVAAPAPSVKPPGPTGDPAKLTVRKAGGHDNMEYLKTPDANSGASSGPVVPQRIGGTPLQGTPVGIEGEQGGIAIGKGTTDAMGNVTFKDLKPGRYTVKVEGTVPAAQFLTVSTSINGKLQSRADFPVGSSVGTFTVSNARDTITLAFTAKDPVLTPTNGTGGMGGGR
jgi:hypothetical protein